MLFCGCAGKSGDKSPAPAATGPKAQTGLPTTIVSITTPDQVYRFTSEVATTSEQQSTGMMYRTSLDEDKGMLFVFASESSLSFWMKDTLIPLDMIFIGANKKIVGINHDAVPQSTTSFTTKSPAKYVLEIKGGFCEAHGIAIGQSVAFDGY